jgi:hypothetical protein
MRRKLTHAMWLALRDSYLAVPGDHRAAADAAGISAETARRAYVEGWPKHDFGRVPLKVEIEKIKRTVAAGAEATLEAARLNAELESVRERTAEECKALVVSTREKIAESLDRYRIGQDAREALQQEAEMVRSARTTAQQFMIALAAIDRSGALDALMANVGAAFRKPMSATTAAKALEGYARAIKAGGEMINTALQSERLIGDPREYVEAREVHDDADLLSDEELIANFTQRVSALRDALATGLPPDGEPDAVGDELRARLQEAEHHLGLARMAKENRDYRIARGLPPVPVIDGCDDDYPEGDD